MSGPPTRVIARLEALTPDLIFNTAEGYKGKTREAFYPSLFDELGVPFTGSDAYTLCITLDKMLTKRVLSAYGVPTPRARLVSRATIESGALDDMVYPVIVKPNFEGSSEASPGPSASARTPESWPRWSAASSTASGRASSWNATCAASTWPAPTSTGSAKAASSIRSST